MFQLFFIGIAGLSLVQASDLSCTMQGGNCQDYRYYICNGGYETGMCDGDSNQQCCFPCNNACQNDLSTWDDCCDTSCTSQGGQCYDNSNYCDGYYQSGMCGGPSSRQCCLTSSSGGNELQYGDIRNVDTTGCSSTTASQDGLWYSGVAASREMAETDSSAMEQYKSMIEQAGAQLGIQPAVIAGIISRETRAGTVLGSDGYGADGHGYGLMQVDDRYHTIQGGPYSLQNILQGTGILIDMINGVSNKHRTWSKDMNLKGGICAYNSGVSNVDTYENMDQGTTGNDYSNDVTARSQYYIDIGY